MDRHEIGRLLGSGAFAQVYEARHRRSGQTVAIKVVDLERIGRGRREEDQNNGRSGQTVAIKVVDLERMGRGRREEDQNNDDGGSKRGYVEDTLSCFGSSMSEPDGRPGSAVKLALDAVAREVEVHRAASSSTKPGRRSVPPSSGGHPNVVSLLDSFRCPAFLPPCGCTVGTRPPCSVNPSPVNGVALVLEHCSLGDLHSYMRRTRDAAKRRSMGTAENSNLSDGGGTFLPEDEVHHAISHVLRGLAFLHSRGIVHRDIKAGNIFLCPVGPSRREDTSIEHECQISGRPNDSKPESEIAFSLLDCTLKIGDFGLAVQMDDDDDWDDAQHTVCGTPSCLAPEVALSTPKASRQKAGGANKAGDSDLDSILLEFQGYDSSEEEYPKAVHDSLLLGEDGKGHGQPADLWSTGCLLYAMLIGGYPFSVPKRPHTAAPSLTREERVQATIGRAVRGEWSIPADIVVSDPAKALLEQLLSLDPTTRGFARGILASHQFLRTQAERQTVGLVRHRQHVSDDTPNHLFNTDGKADNDASAPRMRPPRHPMAPVPDRSKIVAKVKTTESTSLTLPTFQGLSMSNAASRQSLSHSNSQLNVGSESAGALSMVHRTAVSSKVRENTDPNILCTPNLDGEIGSESQQRMACTVAECRFDFVNSPGADEGPSFDDRGIRTKAVEFLDPIEAMHRLPTMKHQWKEVKRKDGGSTRTVLYTAYILPNRDGAVIHREDTNRRGLWMHVTTDGLRVTAGKLSCGGTIPKSSRLLGRHAQGGDNASLTTDAFSRAPMSLKQAPTKTDSSFLTSPMIATGGISATLASLSFSTATASVSAQSLPLTSLSDRHYEMSRGRHSLYKPLSSLLAQKSKSHLSLYRKLEGVVHSIKRCTPKITLYIYSPHHKRKEDSSETIGAGGLIAKTMLMENSPFPQVESTFVDGFMVRYQLSAGTAELCPPNNCGGGSFTVDFRVDESPLKKKSGTSLADDSVRQAKYSNYISLAQIAAQECLWTERCCDTSQPASYREQTSSARQGDTFPVIKRMIAQGASREDWIDASTCSSGPKHELI